MFCLGQVSLNIVICCFGYFWCPLIFFRIFKKSVIFSIFFVPQIFFSFFFQKIWNFLRFFFGTPRFFFIFFFQKNLFLLNLSEDRERREGANPSPINPSARALVVIVSEHFRCLSDKGGRTNSLRHRKADERLR